MRYNLTPFRMSKIKKTDHIKCCWKGCGTIGTFTHHCWEFPTTLENSLVYIYTNTWTQIYREDLFAKIKNWKQPKCPSKSEWKQIIAYLFNGILLSNRRGLRTQKHG